MFHEQVQSEHKAVFAASKDSARASDPLAHLWKSPFDASADAQIICRAGGRIEHFKSKAIEFLKSSLAQRKTGLCVFDLFQTPADTKLRQLLQREPAKPDMLYSAGLALPGTNRAPVDLEITPLADGHTLVAFKDTSRRLRHEAHVRRLITAIDATPDAAELIMRVLPPGSNGE